MFNFVLPAALLSVMYLGMKCAHRAIDVEMEWCHRIRTPTNAGCAISVLKLIKTGGNRKPNEEEMAKGGDRTVYRGGDGKWVNKKNDAERASSRHDTQREAEKAARDMLKKSGGGELTTMGRDGKIRSKDTIPLAKDPNPPRDTEH